MAFSSTFYDTLPGEGVKETTWAQSAPSRGALFGVAAEDDFKITAHPTIPYTVNIGPGKAWGHGVFDDVTGTTAVTCATPGNGVNRWDLIAIRRDWQPTGGGPSSFRAITGTTAQSIPTTRENRPGIVADQPLYLVQWQGGTTTPKAVIDLRCFANMGGVEILHTLARSYLGFPGAALKLGTSVWRFERVNNSQWDWKEYVAADPTAPLFRHGFRVVTTNPDGYCTVPFDTPFPNSCKIAIPVILNPPSGMAIMKFISGEKAAANFLVTAINGLPLRNAAVTIGYIATGS